MDEVSPVSVPAQALSARPGRESGIELLRIAAMAMIVANHFVTHGALGLPSAPLSANLLFAQLLACGGKFGVDVFVLVSGWFLATRKDGAGPRLAGLWTKTVLYAATVWAVLRFAFGRPGSVWNAVFPLTHDTYWFVTSYFCAVLLSPYLNAMCANLPRGRHARLVLTLLVLFSAVPSVLVFPGWAGRRLFGFSDTLWFLVLFVLASYLRRHVDFAKVRARRLLAGFAACFAAMCLYVLWCDWAVRHGGGAWKWSAWRDMNSLAVVGMSVCLLGLFSKLRLGSLKPVNAVAACMLGVYLLHDHFMMRPILWRRPSVFAASRHFAAACFPLHAAFSVLSVFLLATAAAALLDAVFRVPCRLATRLAEKAAAKWGSGAEGAP